MSIDGGHETRVAAPPLPRSIWLVAWASLVGELVHLVQQGPRLEDEVSLVGSVVLGAVVVGYVSAGVVRARPVRSAIAWVVLVLILVGELLGLGSLAGPDEVVLALLSLGTTVTALAGLASFRRTEWYAWQRTRPSVHDGPPIGQLVAIGALVGALGGLSGPAEDGINLRLQVADRPALLTAR